MPDLLTFDPAAVTVDDVPALSGPRCREVIAHYRLPKPHAAAKVSELRQLATLAVQVAPETPQDAPGAVPEPEVAPGPSLEPVTPSEVIPTAARWQQLVAMGEFLAKADLTPVGLRDKPANVTSVLLAANDLGIPLTQALNKLHVIDGKVGMAAELMVALVLRDGHDIWPDPANDATQATWHGKRRDNDRESSATFTIDEAVHAGLCSFGDDGAVRARASSGKKKPWEVYTADMLSARARARLCRALFPDSLGGVSYTPDELGYINADDDPGPKAGRHGEATVTLDQERDVIAGRIQALDEDLRKEVAGEWRHRNLQRVVELTPGGIRAARAILEPLEARQTERAADATVADAVVVEDVREGGEPDVGLGEVIGVGAEPCSTIDAVSSPTGLTDDAPCPGCGEVIQHPLDITEETVFADDGEWHAACYHERPM